MKKTIFIICFSLAILLFTNFLSGQNLNHSILHIYREKDLGWPLAMLYFDNDRLISLRRGNYDTLHIKPDCYCLKVNMNKKDMFTMCFEAGKEYYFSIEYKYIFPFPFPRFKLVEVTKKYAESEIDRKKIERKSSKN